MSPKKKTAPKKERTIASIAADSDDPAELDSLPAGSRLFVVQVYDPTLDKTIAGGTVLEPDQFDQIDAKCAQHNIAFARGLLYAAADQVMGRMFQGDPPDGVKVKDVMEVSRRELLAMMEAHGPHTVLFGEQKEGLPS